MPGSDREEGVDAHHAPDDPAVAESCVGAEVRIAEANGHFRRVKPSHDRVAGRAARKRIAVLREAENFFEKIFRSVSKNAAKFLLYK